MLPAENPFQPLTLAAYPHRGWNAIKYLATQQFLQVPVGLTSSSSTAPVSKIAPFLSICNRISILVVGVSLALILFMPNGMMSDSGTKKAQRAAGLGIATCIGFLIGGVAGCFCNSWFALVPAMVLQVLAFIVFA